MRRRQHPIPTPAARAHNALFLHRSLPLDIVLHSQSDSQLRVCSVLLLHFNKYQFFDNIREDLTWPHAGGKKDSRRRV